MADDTTKPTATIAAGVAKQAEAVQKTATRIEASAGAVQRSAGELTDSADRRTVLAADRTMLASERTYAAWIRTGLVALASGVGARALMEHQLPRWMAIGTAVVMITFSMFCFLAAVWRNFQRGERPSPDVPRLPSALLVASSGLLFLVALASMAGVLISAEAP